MDTIRKLMKNEKKASVILATETEKKNYHHLHVVSQNECHGQVKTRAKGRTATQTVLQ